VTATITFPVISGNAAGFNRLPIVGGGFVTGLDISVDASRKVCSPDVTGPYIQDGTGDWRPLLTSSSLQSSEYDPWPNNYGAGLSDGPGCYAARMAPSNKDVIVVVTNALVRRSTDGGNSFTRCNLAAKKMLANTGQQRLWNRKLDIHPTDPLTFLVGTDGDGQYYTTDGGQNFTSIGIAAGTTFGGAATPHLVAFDPGAPLNVFITRHGTGLYRATAGVGGAFTLVTGPTTFRQLHVTAGGTVWICTTTGELWKLARGSTSWVQISAPPGALSVHSFAVNPADLNSLVVMDSDGISARSIDGGATWVGSDRWVATFPAPVGLYNNSSQVPWLDHIGGLFPSHLQFDPVAVNKVWLAHGTGVSYSNPPTTFVRWDWYDISSGIEELVFVCGLSIPGNSRPLFGAWDKAIWRPRNLDHSRDAPIFPDSALASTNVDHCYSMDYATGAAAKVYAVVNLNHNISGYSVNGGATWQPFAAQHPDGALGGCVAATGDGKLIWVPANNGKAVRSGDGGASWSYINMGGSVGGIVNWIAATYVRRHIVTADHERAGAAAIVVNTAVDSQTQTISGGVYRTLDDGQNWTQRLTGLIDATSDTAQAWHATLKYIPGKSGELLYTAGRDFASRLMWSQNDATSFTALRSSEINNVRNFTFGMAAPLQSYPTVFFDGTVNGVSGLYSSTDFFATSPRLLARFPAGVIIDRDFICGDMNVFGRLYVGPTSNGLLYGNFP
jgi:hypothetical protein